jgi:hypothetical protein
MGEKSLADQISQLMNDTPAMVSKPGGENPDEQKKVLVDSLKAVAGESDGALEAAFDEFLNGKGVLHEATRTAITRGGSAGRSDVITLLTKQFKLSPAVAKMIASLIMKLQSSGSVETAKESTTKKKSRRKAKPKTASSAKKETSSAKKAKKKPAAKAKKTISKTKPRSTKKTASQKAATKKSSAKTSRKKTTAKAQPEKAKRTSSVEISQGYPSMLRSRLKSFHYASPGLWRFNLPSSVYRPGISSRWSQHAVTPRSLRQKPMGDFGGYMQWKPRDLPGSRCSSLPGWSTDVAGVDLDPELF